MKSVTLEKDYSIKLSSNVVNYIYPDHVFVSINSGYKLQVGNKETIKKEQLLLKNAEGIEIYSPVSGIVVGAKECILADGSTKKCLVIENDFKEKMYERNTMRKNIKQLSKNDFYDILANKGVLNNNCDLLLNLFKEENFDKIIVNGIEDEPYVATKIFELRDHASIILETLSFLASIFNTKENILVLKNNDRDNIEIYSNILGTYPEICLDVVPDIYPIGKKVILKKYINCDLDKSLVLLPRDIIACYHAIKKNKLVTEKYITITGNAIVNPIVVNAKLGSSVKKIIDEHIKFLNNLEVDYIINGLMCGMTFSVDDLIVTNDLDSIIINFSKDYKSRECINCGKCSEVCPVSIDPNLIFNKKKNIELKEKCINCGLCTYICPVYINFKNKIEEMKNGK